jgi:hypothetical protein
MKLLLILAILLIPALLNAQKRDKLYIGFQVQPELTFYKSQYPFVSPTTYSKSSFNIGFNINGQYQITDRLFATLGLGFISRKLNTSVNVDQSRLPVPYYDSGGPAYFTKTLSFRLLQIPLGFGYDFFKTKKANLFASIVFVPDFLLNEKYNTNNYPVFQKNYWQGISLNPTIGVDYNLSQKIKLTGALAYSVFNTVKPEEFSNREPELKHTYLQLGLGAKLKLK